MTSSVIPAGLRIDVDTLRGTRLGVPNLLAELARQGIRATFFFSVGPDNMGRHLWRLLRPSFLLKMLRTRAASLYGWDILLKGTAWPGPLIGKRARAEIRAAAAAGHEIGLHAWDHHRWQARVEKLDRVALKEELLRGYETLAEIVGQPVDCAAVPGWRLTEEALGIREGLPFRYLSDCRGESIFFPLLAGKRLHLPQIPTTLPTYDELLGRDGVTAENYNQRLLDLFRPEGLNVLTIHAEAEGISCRALFADFLAQARARGIVFQPLGACLQAGTDYPSCSLLRQPIHGREGWVACQGGTDSHTPQPSA